MISLPPKPIIGQAMTYLGIACRVTKVCSYGTIEVQAIGSGQAWRVSGLGWAMKP